MKNGAIIKMNCKLTIDDFQTLVTRTDYGFNSDIYYI